MLESARLGTDAPNRQRQRQGKMVKGQRQRPKVIGEKLEIGNIIIFKIPGKMSSLARFSFFDHMIKKE